MTDKKFSHIDSSGKADMVDVGDKTPQRRIAIAEGMIRLEPHTIELIRDNGMKKGEVLSVARIAGIQGGKQCANLIPLCHNLMLEKVGVELKLTETGVLATAITRCTGKTGVEMEALTAVSVALLTVYDMCKAVDTKMEIGEIRLLSKTKEDLA